MKFFSRKPEVLVVSVSGADVNQHGDLVNPNNVRFEQKLTRLENLSPNEHEAVKRALRYKV